MSARRPWLWATSMGMASWTGGCQHGGAKLLRSCWAMARVTSPRPLLPTGVYPISVAVGDFNEDGKLDLAVANLDGGSVSVLLGDGTGHFTLASSCSRPVRNQWLWETSTGMAIWIGCGQS